MTTSTFLIRIELHDGDSEDYEILHDAMARKGFKRTVSSAGVEYDLPTAMYLYSGDQTTSEVHKKADAAAQSTALAYAIFVAMAADAVFSGLKETTVSKGLLASQILKKTSKF
jgi:hypothetical protein